MILTPEQLNQIFSRLNGRWNYFQSLNADPLMSPVVKDIFDDAMRLWMLFNNERILSVEYKTAMRRLAIDNSNLQNAIDTIKRAKEQTNLMDALLNEEKKNGSTVNKSDTT